MNEPIFALSPSEQAFKKLYLEGGSQYLERPMTISEYQLLSHSQEAFSENIRRYHSLNPNHRDINTIRDPYSESDPNMVGISMHGRYSYPLLHNHAYVELVYVYSGTCRHFIEKDQIEMNTGDFCILAPNTVHAISASTDDSIILNIMVSPAFFGNSFFTLMRGTPILVDFFKNILYHKTVSPYILYPTGTDEWMQHTLKWMCQLSRRKGYLYQEALSLYVRQVFIHLLRNYEMEAVIANPLNHSQENNIVALISYISLHYDHITLDSTAKFFGYNTTYLSQLLKRCTGKTFTEMITEERIQNACQLLTETGFPITEIAQKVGCYDSSHLTRLFKLSTGVTPLQYRKKNQNGG